ncbi:M24 family metallopeptidase [Candidatus Cryosericum septentrionale]|jgi:Xaa-Pro aminopeptidase|uniref:Aminopeptidase P family protein n=1 Tax=Candidatus Cryosericum septentrionale TaxID=2290913 RepID=A0A398DS94_9BACT|nr:Xaa-Pro peptidase family protein [Candidatus Cryosericum septentrionale]RIE16899.1 aminopeptidase P family protein [Candidatus Cryosericum septentrionale]
MENSYHQRRIELLRERMDVVNVDAFFTLAAPSMRYLTGFTGEEGYLVVLHDGMHLVVDGRFTTQAQEECPWLDVTLYTGHFSRSIANLLVASHAHWLGFEKERVSFVQAEQMRAAFPSVTMVPTESVVEDMRIVKDGCELDMMRAAGRVADKAFNVMVHQLKAGMTENDVAALLEYEMRKAGAGGTSFSTIVGSGARGALPHGIASGKVIQSGEVIVIDFGVNYEGYMSDCTRTVALGEQPADVLDVYAKLRAAQQLGLDCIKAGVSSRSVDTMVRGKLGESGLAQYFTHGLGHGVGLEIHEAPRLSQGTDTVLEPGQVVTCEPGVYLPGRYGMRIEDSVIVTATGFESLTELAKELVLP